MMVDRYFLSSNGYGWPVDEDIDVDGKWVKYEDIKPLLAEITALKGVLMEASTDIHHWVQLAKKQREELPNVEFLPCGPTTRGIERSCEVLKAIGNAMKATDSN